MDHTSSHSTAVVGSDPMDVGEIISAIWSRKQWIFVFMALGVALSVLYVRTATPLYTSEAIIALSNEKKLSGGVGGLSELAGLDNNDPTKQMIDRIMARDFIMQIVDDLNLREDSYYNPLPVPHTGVLQAVKKVRDRVFGPRALESADDRITRRYRKAVKLSISRGDSITIKSIHRNSDRATAIANRIATLSLEVLKDDARRSYLDQQEYLVELMAKAQDDIDRAQRALSRLERTSGSEFSQFTLQRDARIAEAVYNTLVEKVQTQMAVMGYEGEVGAIYQTATSSARPSRPSVSVALAGGLMGGAILGVMLALVFALSSGTLFTRRSISRALRARNEIYPEKFDMNAKSISRSLKQIDRAGTPWLPELLWSIIAKKSELILVIPTASRVASTQVALLIGRSLANSGKQTAVILLDRKAIDNVRHYNRSESIFSKEIVEIRRCGALHIFVRSKESTAADVVMSSGLIDGIRAAVASDYSYVVTGVTDKTATAAAISLSAANPVAVVITKVGETKRRLIAQLKTVLDPDINIGI